MRKVLIFALAFTFVVAGVEQANAKNQIRDHRRVMACHQIDWQHDTAHFIRCAARAWKAPSTPGYVVSIARCESGLRPSAYNPNGHGGLFQHDTGAWSSRARKYLVPLAFNAGIGWANGEANTIVAIRMARSYGYWPSSQWSCA